MSLSLLGEPGPSELTVADGRLEAARAFYADLVVARGGFRNERLAAAFRTVRREEFLPAGPWQVVASTSYVQTPSDDPIHLCQDVVVAIDPGRGINNGEPSLHARFLNAVLPRPGEHVVHVGCGTGYYTAILGELVGTGGGVIAMEIDPGLAEMAKRNLAGRPQVQVLHRSGAGGALPEAEIVYVSAAASRPLDIWLDALVPGGRMVFPLTSSKGEGVALLVRRLGAGFTVDLLSRAFFIPCVGAVDPKEDGQLAALVKSGVIWQARSLWRRRDPDESALLVGEGWWLSSSPVQ